MNNFLAVLLRVSGLLIILGTSLFARSQQLSIDSCYQLAQQNFPAIKKHALLEESGRFNRENAGAGWLPQFNITGQATYQSETVNISKAMGNALPPGIAIPEINRDQYKIQAELTQSIYDGGSIHSRKKILEASEKLQQQQVEITLHTVKERVNQLFFSILLADQQLAQHMLRRSDLQNAADRTEAALANGAAFRSSLYELQAELVNTDMVTTELEANRHAWVQMLGLLIGRPLPAGIKLVMPAPVKERFDVAGRPELKLYDYQQQLYDAEENSLKTGYTPRLNAFVQGAYGRPTLNIVENKFGAWYIGGLRLQWNFGSLYTLKNDKRIMEMNRQLAEADRETFLLNTQVDISRQEAAVEKFRQLLAQDHRLVELRTAVKLASRAQLDNGVITTREFIAQVNAESLARQNMALHNIQLLQTQYTLNYLSGN